MRVVTTLKTGMVVRRDNELFRLLSVEKQAGAGQMGGFVHASAKSLRSGHVKEWRLHPEDRLEEVSLERQEMEYLYADGDSLYFMNPETFDQIAVPRELIGHRERFLQENMRVPVEVFEGNPINVKFPDVVELKVITAPPGLREHDTSTMKSVTLQNGAELLVPQFIEEGDVVRVDVETGRYVDRVRETRKA